MAPVLVNGSPRLPRIPMPSALDHESFDITLHRKDAEGFGFVILTSKSKPPHGGKILLFCFSFVLTNTKSVWAYDSCSLSWLKSNSRYISFIPELSLQLSLTKLGVSLKAAQLTAVACCTSEIVSQQSTAAPLSSSHTMTLFSLLRMLAMLSPLLWFLRMVSVFVCP